MIQLNPRSYVFNGFDVIRLSLIKYIGKTLKKSDKKDWWNFFIYNKFNNPTDPKKKLPKTGNANDLYDHLDDSLCLKIIREYGHKTFTKLDANDLAIVRELLEIRNTCAHATGEYVSLDFAANALTKMAALMHKLNPDSEQILYSLRTRMFSENINNKPVVASKETLIQFLDEKVLVKAQNDPRATKEILR